MNDMLRAITRAMVLLVVLLLVASTLAGMAGCAGDTTVALPPDNALTLADCNHHPQACT